ncbi:MAG: outer membrane beta-barrel protein [Bacteroidetes bacterium]|nr:outer membrane beta-barrel protein [Bacteroidota bacterium]
MKSICFTNRIFLSFFLLILFVGTTSSQAELRLSAGLNASSFPSDVGEFNFSSAAGYQFGAELQYGDQFFFQAGLFFEKTSTEIKLPYIGTSSGDLEINRLRVPVYIGYRFASNTSWLNFRLFTGPNASISVNRSISDAFNLGDDEFSSVLFGYNVGGGLDIAFLFVDIGYMFGLNDVLEFEDSSSSNNLFFANAGLRLKF